MLIISVEVTVAPEDNSATTKDNSAMSAGGVSMITVIVTAFLIVL